MIKYEFLITFPNFFMLWEVPDQREPTMEGLESAQSSQNFPQNWPSKANFEGQVR